MAGPKYVCPKTGLGLHEVRALVWLNSRNGTGVFGKTMTGRGDAPGMSNNVLLAAGDKGPFMRTTWNELRDRGFVTIEGKRLTVTETGRAVTHVLPVRPRRADGKRGIAEVVTGHKRTGDALEAAVSLDDIDTEQQLDDEEYIYDPDDFAEDAE